MSDQVRMALSDTGEFQEVQSNVFQAGQPQEESPGVHMTNTNKYSVTVSGDEMTTDVDSGVRRVTQTDLRQDAFNGSVVSTARSSFGSPISASQLTKDSVVTLPGGLETSVEVAESLGYLKFEHGTWVDSDRPEQSTEQPQEQQQVESIGDEAEQHLQGLTEALPEQMADSLAVNVMNNILGNTGAVKLHDIAAVTGHSGEALSGSLSSVVAGFQKQADEAVMKAGVPDPYDFYTWAKANKPGQLQEAMMNQYYGRTTKGYGALAESYLRSTTPQNFGNLPTRQSNGKTLVVVDGVELEAAVAARLGYI